MRQRFSQDILRTKQNPAAKPQSKQKEKDQSLTSKLISHVLTAAFFPAYVAYSATKMATSLPFVPLKWAIKRFVPNLVDDLSDKKHRFQETVKDHAGRGFMTLSSLLAKYVPSSLS